MGAKVANGGTLKGEEDLFSVRFIESRNSEDACIGDFASAAER